MKNYFICLLFPLLGYHFSMSQYDPRAKKIMEQVSRKYLSLESYRVTFRQDIVRIKDQTIIDSTEGEITVKGEQYSLDIGQQKIFNNGTKIWNYSKDLNEVYVSDYDPEAINSLEHPSAILKMYSQGFKYRLEKLSENIKKFNVVYLIPENLKDDSITFFQLKVYIDSKNRIVKWESFEKGNMLKYIFNVTPPVEIKNIKSVFFTFDATKYPNVEIIE